MLKVNVDRKDTSFYYLTMIAQQDLQSGLNNLKKELRDEFNQAINDAVAQISGAIIKSLQNTATKDDLKNLATKDDLKNTATKDGLKNLATKDDIKRVESDLSEVKEKVNNLETDMKVVKRGIDILQKTTPNKIDFNDHEKRIKRLESTILNP